MLPLDGGEAELGRSGVDGRLDRFGFLQARAIGEGGVWPGEVTTDAEVVLGVVALGQQAEVLTVWGLRTALRSEEGRDERHQMFSRSTPRDSRRERQ